jgi:hypothetical protein
MSHYEKKYTSSDRKADDEQAIQDIVEYLGMKRIPLFGDLVQLAVCVEHEILCKGRDGELHKQTIEGLNMTLGFAGISGRPFHAFCRRYCLNKYREWMASNDGGSPVQTDEEGFRIKE